VSFPKNKNIRRAVSTLCVTLLTTFLAITASADQLKVSEWKKDHAFGSLIGTSSRRHQGEGKISIEYDTNGEKTLVLRFIAADGFECPRFNPDEIFYAYQNVIISANGQAIKAVEVCVAALDQEFSFFKVELATAKGRDFLVSEFRRSLSVTIELSNDEFLFSAVGFKKAWDSPSSSAL